MGPPSSYEFYLARLIAYTPMYCMVKTSFLSIWLTCQENSPFECDITWPFPTAIDYIFVFFQMSVGVGVLSIK